MTTTAFNEYGEIKRVALRHAKNAMVDQAKVDSQWQDLNYHAKPNVDQAFSDYDSLAEIVASKGAEVTWLPQDDSLTIDAIYVRDASIISANGLVLCNMGKDARKGEPRVAADNLGLPIAGASAGDGAVEGGDFIWLDEKTAAIAHGYRTNQEGINQLHDLIGRDVELHVVPLPHYKGEDDVFHLMSIISPVDHDLAVVHSRLMPVPFRQWLIKRGMKFVEVPAQEFDSMGCNVLAIAPRVVVMVKGNPITKQRMEDAGCQVIEYDGSEISLKGEGGPTCLTRPLVRG
jgi:N-dimethylarginine dimethylaminohydrolase